MRPSRGWEGETYLVTGATSLPVADGICSNGPDTVAHGGFRMERMLGRETNIRVWMIVLLGLIVLALPVSAVNSTGLTFVSAGGTSGSISRVPLLLNGIPEPVGVLNLTLAYNPALLTALDVKPGDTGVNTTLTVVMDRGFIELIITDPDGIPEGTLAYVRFNVLANTGSSPLRITHLAATSTATRAPLPLPRHEGTFTIIGGVSFSTTAGGQRIAVDPSLASSAVRVTGDAITFTRDDMTVTCLTKGLAEGAGRKTGIVSGVSVTSPPFAINLPAGLATGQFTTSTATYESEGRLWFILEDPVPAATRERFISGGERAQLNISTVLFTARVVSEGFSSTSPVTATFTLPATLLSPSSNESLRVGFSRDDGTVEFAKPAIGQETSTGTLIITFPIKEGYPTLAILLAEEIARPTSTVIPPRTTGQNIFAEGGETAGVSIWTGAFMIFFLVAVVVIGVFYVHKRRGG